MSKISQKIELNQQLSPQQVLQANLLQLSLPLLEQRILKELEVNPALEMVDLSADQQEEDIAEKNEEIAEDIEFEWEELLGVNDDYEYSDTAKKIDEEYETPLVANETFSEKMMIQLQDCDLSKKDLEISEQVLGNLDEQGYLNIDPALISDRMDINEQDVINVMKIIQKLDPIGIASRNIQECLLVQAEVKNENPYSIKILRDSFDDFVNHRYEKILEKIGCSKEKFNCAIEYISRLNPSPRDDYAFEKQDIIIPDIAVENSDEKFFVVVQDGSLPDIRVSSAYEKMLNKYQNQKDVKKFVKKKLESAHWFVEAVQQRKRTIQLVMESIIKHQPNYFSLDKRKLKPMILKDVAQDIKMDVSTVSRVTNGKYVQLPWEIKELKTFFSESIETFEGDSVSNTEVKQLLKDIIEVEDKSDPISDEDLTKKINEHGYKIARRTISKYREELKIPIARLRRQL